MSVKEVSNTFKNDQNQDKLNHGLEKRTCETWVDTFQKLDLNLMM